MLKFFRQYNDGFDNSSFDVEVTEVPPEVDDMVNAMLTLLRDKLEMRVAFVFDDQPGGPAVVSAPIVLKNAQVYGTLLCFGADGATAPSLRDARYLRYAAQFIAGKLNARVVTVAAPLAARPALTPVSDWELQPLERRRFAFR